MHAPPGTPRKRNPRRQLRVLGFFRRSQDSLVAQRPEPPHVFQGFWLSIVLRTFDSFQPLGYSLPNLRFFLYLSCRGRAARLL